jgi:NAD(P)-dependent dehydrogenase (short-subunit alcohol dehydrogenase family)
MASNDAKTALVTGASSGIGLAITQRLLSAGWQVIGLSRRRAEISHPAFAHRTADLLSEESLSSALENLPVVAALVHSAGILRLDSLGASDATAGEAMWRLHVDAAVCIADVVVPRMPDGSRILLLGSRASIGSAGRAQYAASKAALKGLARSWALELVRRRITVNIISPAATDTAMQRDPARAAVKPKLPPFGSMIDPQEIAALAEFLLSSNGRNITGQEIFVCGGASL